MAASAALFSVMSALVKFAGLRLHSQQIVLARSVVMLALCFGWTRARAIDMRGVNRRLLWLRGVLGFAALSCFFFAVTRLPLADVTVLHFTNPAMTAVIAAVVLREHMSTAQSGLMAVGFAGIVLVVRPSFLFGEAAAALDTWGVVAALLGAILAAFVYVLVRQLRKTDHPLVIILYFSLVSAVLAVPTAIPVWLWPTPTEWAALGSIGFVTFVAQVCLTKGLHLEPAGRAMTIGYLQIVFAYFWGIVLFAEMPTVLGGIGALVVVASTWAIGRSHSDEAAERPAPGPGPAA